MIQVVKNESDIPYQCEKKMGSGSFAQVYKAVHRKTGKQYAIKKALIDPLYQGPDGQICKQIARLSSLKGEHIIEFYESYKLDNEIWIVMKLCNGSLRDLMQKKESFSAREISLILVQITKAMEVLDSHKTMHLDLKPENILYLGDMNLRLCDFGCAQLTEKGSFSKVSFTQFNFGTEPYMPPQIKLGKHAGCRSSQDIWSLGVIGYQLLYKTRPIKNPSQIHELWEGKRFIRFPRVSEDKKIVLSLVRQMLEIRPDNRPRWKHIHQKLVNYLDREQVEFMPVSSAHRLYIETKQLFIFVLRQLQINMGVHVHDFWLKNRDELKQMRKAIIILFYLYSLKFKELFGYKILEFITIEDDQAMKFMEKNITVEMKKYFGKSENFPTLNQLAQYQDRLNDIFVSLQVYFQKNDTQLNNWISIKKLAKLCQQAIKMPSPSLFCCARYFPEAKKMFQEK